jgi:hypothetical protein
MYQFVDGILRSFNSSPGQLDRFFLLLALTRLYLSHDDGKDTSVRVVQIASFVSFALGVYVIGARSCRCPVCAQYGYILVAIFTVFTLF